MNEENNTQLKNYKRIIIILSIIILSLISYIIYLKKDVKIIIQKEVIERTKANTERDSLQRVFNNLMEEHKKLNENYGTLTKSLKEKDSIIQKNAKEIQKLLLTEKDLKRVSRKLDYLRNIVQGYLHQIDSLQTANQLLKTENTKIKGDYHKEKSKTEELTKDKEQLTEKVNLASTLKAYKVTCSAIKLKSGGKKEEPVEKAKKTDKIKICFTLSENLLAKSGQKNIYVRIAGPNNEILRKGDSDAYSFINNNNERLQFSIMKQIDYENKAMDICLYWDKIKPFDPGTYNVTIYAEGYQIGTGQFSIK
jgi:chromosome segregation ATPase